MTGFRTPGIYPTGRRVLAGTGLAAMTCTRTVGTPTCDL